MLSQYSWNTDLLIRYAARLLALLIAIPVHESAHAYVSSLFGDPTAKRLGRISLNPIRHFDPMGALAMLLFGFGWAKPVPIDPRYYQNKKVGMAISSLAGPMSNLLLAMVSMVLAKLFHYLNLGSGNQVWDVLYTIFLYMTMINILLGIFNMIPIPPLDGSRILLLFLPERLYFQVMQYERYLILVLLFLLWSGVLSGPLLSLQQSALVLLDNLTRFVDKLAAPLVLGTASVL